MNDVQVWPPVPSEPSNDELPSATSKFGGYPDVGSDFVWPRDSENDPLPFFAQINFSETVDADINKQLPSGGLLVLFLNGTYTEWKALYYHGNLSDLARKEPPDDMDEMFRLVPPYCMAFTSEWTVPEQATFEARSLGLSETEQGQYYEFQSSLIAVTGELDSFGKENESHHTLLGWADTFDGDGRTEWSHEIWEDSEHAGSLADMTEDDNARYNKVTAESCLLLQIETLNFYSGIWDYGWEPFFYIRKRDLESRNLENLWVVGAKS
ncbi:MAG: DUF1963 domain-containing protein [Fibrella sp.]|nr:DUF1963 domain-containing protein [Armatimonadota bacterium]